LTGKPKEAIETCRGHAARAHNIFIYLQLVATTIMMGEAEEARGATARFMKIIQFSLRQYAR
jgi:hypothetical protein